MLAWNSHVADKYIFTGEHCIRTCSLLSCWSFLLFVFIVELIYNMAGVCWDLTLSSCWRTFFGPSNFRSSDFIHNISPESKIGLFNYYCSMNLICSSSLVDNLISVRLIYYCFRIRNLAKAWLSRTKSVR